MGNNEDENSVHQKGTQNGGNNDDNTGTAPPAGGPQWLIPQYRVGRRTGIDVRAGRDIRRLSNGMENFSDFFDSSYSPVKEPPEPLPAREYCIGRRTGIDVRAGRDIRRLSNGMENFSDFFDVSPSPAKVPDQSSNGAEVDPARLKAISIRQGKSIRRLSNGIENFSDFLSDSSPEKSAPKGEQDPQTAAVKSAPNTEAGSVLEKNETVEVKRACTPTCIPIIGDPSGIVNATLTEKTDILKWIEHIDASTRKMSDLDEGGNSAQAKHRQAKVSDEPELLDKRVPLFNHLVPSKSVTSKETSRLSSVVMNSQVSHTSRREGSWKRGLLLDGSFGLKEAAVTLDLKSTFLEHPETPQGGYEQHDRSWCCRTQPSDGYNTVPAGKIVPPLYGEYQCLSTAQEALDVAGSVHGASSIHFFGSDERVGGNFSSHASYEEDPPPKKVKKERSSKQRRTESLLGQQLYSQKQLTKRGSKRTSSPTGVQKSNKNRRVLNSPLRDAAVQDKGYNQPKQMETRLSIPLKKALIKRFPASKLTTKDTGTDDNQEERAEQNEPGTCHESLPPSEHEVHQGSHSSGNERRHTVAASEHLEGQSLQSGGHQVQDVFDKASEPSVQPADKMDRGKVRSTRLSSKKRKESPDEKGQKSAKKVKVRKTVFQMNGGKSFFLTKQGLNRTFSPTGVQKSNKNRRVLNSPLRDAAVQDKGYNQPKQMETRLSIPFKKALIKRFPASKLAIKDTGTDDNQEERAEQNAPGSCHEDVPPCEHEVHQGSHSAGNERRHIVAASEHLEGKSLRSGDSQIQDVFDKASEPSVQSADKMEKGKVRSTRSSSKRRKQSPDKKRGQKSAKDVKVRKTVSQISDGIAVKPMREVRTRQPPPPKDGIYVPIYEYRPGGPVFLRYEQLDPSVVHSKGDAVSTNPSRQGGKKKQAPVQGETSPEGHSESHLLQPSYRCKQPPKRKSRNTSSMTKDVKSTRSRRVLRDAAMQDKGDNRPKQMETRLSIQHKKAQIKRFPASKLTPEDTGTDDNQEERVEQNELGSCHERAPSPEHEVHQGSQSSGNEKNHTVAASEHLEDRSLQSKADQIQGASNKASKPEPPLPEQPYRYRQQPKRSKETILPASDPKLKKCSVVLNRLPSDTVVQYKQHTRRKQSTTGLRTTPKASAENFFFSKQMTMVTACGKNCEEMPQQNEPDKYHESAESPACEVHDDDEISAAAPSDCSEHPSVWSGPGHVEDPFETGRGTSLQSTPILSKVKVEGTDTSPAKKVKVGGTDTSPGKKRKSPDGDCQPLTCTQPLGGGMTTTSTQEAQQRSSSCVGPPIASPETRARIDNVLVHRACDLKFLNPSEILDDEEDSAIYKVATYVLMDSCHMGIMRLEAGKEKHTSVILNHHAIFLAMDFPVTIAISGKTWTVLRKDDVYVVPIAVPYTIRNVSETNAARILFVVLR